MSIYKLKLNSLVQKANKSYRPKTEEEYKKKLNEFINDPNSKKILLDFENLKININNEEYIFYIRYKENIPPKTKRIVFNLYKTNNKIQNLSEVKQRYLISNYKNFKFESFDIFYEINKEEYQSFLSIFKKILNDKYIPKNSKEIDEYYTFIQNVSIICDVGQKELRKKITKTKFFKLLPIKKYLDYLIENKWININNYSIETNMFELTPENYEKIINKFTFLIIDDINLSTLSFDENQIISLEEIFNNIKLENKNNITIGLIDSGVKLPSEYNEFILSNIDLRQNKKFHDYNHGTSIASLIISNDELNPGNKDGLGNFNIKHFEMLEPYVKDGQPQLSHEFLIKNLEKIIKDNKNEIRVWNLSFGNSKNPFYTTISHLGKFLDYLSYKYDVLFIVAAGNNREKQIPLKSLNFPADSLNALSVGSVMNKNGKTTFSNYSSLGQILHFEKPEVSQFGGPYNEDGSHLLTYDGEYKIKSNNFGTSFSTPRISRIAAFLIANGLKPMEAKAKIISLSNRETKNNKSSSFGYVKFNNNNNNNNNKVELFITTKIIGNKPFYINLNLPEGIEEIIISDCTKVHPNLHNFNLNLGEEYSIHNFHTKLIWYASYDKINKCEILKPENHYVGKKSNYLVATVDESYRNDKQKYQKEDALRFDGGKYFTSHKKYFSIKNINKTKSKIYEDENKKFKPNIYDYKLGLYIKKNDLFDTVEEQEKEVSIYIVINGNFNEKDFENLNESIIDVKIDSNIEVNSEIDISV